MRDTFLLLLRKLAPLAGLAASDNHVFLEPTGLLPEHPTRRPADVAVQTLPNALRDSVSHLLVDTTAISVPDKWNERDSFLTSVSLHHHRQENEKFAGHNRGNLNPGQLAQALVNHRYALLPCTFDPGGSLGPAVSGFLWKPSHRPQPTIPKLHHTEAPLPASQSGRHLRNQCFTTVSSFGLLQRANQGWREDHPEYPDKPYTRYYQARTPSQWATMLLGQNLTLALSRHIAFNSKNGNKIHRKKYLMTASFGTTQTRTAQILPPQFGTYVQHLVGNPA